MSLCSVDVVNWRKRSIQLGTLGANNPKKADTFGKCKKWNETLLVQLLTMTPIYVIYLINMCVHLMQVVLPLSPTRSEQKSELHARSASPDNDVTTSHSTCAVALFCKNNNIWFPFRWKQAHCNAANTSACKWMPFASERERNGKRRVEREARAQTKMAIEKYLAEKMQSKT